MTTIEQRFEPNIETGPGNEKAKEIFDWFRKGTLSEKDLKNLGLEAENLEKEINELIIAKLKEELKDINLEPIAESRDFAGRTKTSVYSHPGLNYVVKAGYDISTPYIIAERIRINKVGAGFVIAKNLECKIKSKETVIPEAVIQTKATSLKEKLEKLLKEENLSEAKLLMEKFINSVQTGWKRGFHFGLDHFTKDYGEDVSGKVVCFDPAIELKKPNVSLEKENIRGSLLEFQALSPQFVDFANKLIEKSLTQKALDETWKTEKGGKNVFIPDDEAVKNVLNFLNGKLKRIEK